MNRSALPIDLHQTLATNNTIWLCTAFKTDIYIAFTPDLTYRPAKLPDG